MHRMAHALATTLHRADLTDYEPTAQAIEDLTDGYTDERKADLYALIQDSVNKAMAFNELVDAVDKALRKNDQRFNLA